MNAYLPNKAGHYHQTHVPQYILNILENVRPCTGHDIGCFGLDTYRLQGVNPVRPGYGIVADMEKLGAWARRYYATFEVLFAPKYSGGKCINCTPKNYYGIFRITDPVVLSLEKTGLL